MKIIDYPKEKRKFLPNLERVEPFFQDSTAYRLLVDCRRKYFYRIVLGRVPLFNKYQIVLDFGTHYHKFRELLETKGYGDAMKYILLDAKLPEVDPKSKFAYLTPQRLLKTCQVAYEHWLQEKKNGKIEVIAVEQPFNVELAPGVFIGGRADQIIKWNGFIWGRDFKTTSKDAGTFDKGLNPNDQAMRYIYGEGKLHGQAIKGIIFEAVYNVKTVGPVIYPKTSSRTPEQLEDWVKEIEFNNWMLKEMRERDIWPMDTHNCGWCDYHEVCRLSSQGSMENALRQKFNYEPWDHTKADVNTSE